MLALRDWAPKLDPVKVVPVLLRLVRSGDEQVVWRAEELIGGMGPLAKDTATALAERLKDKSWLVRLRAVQALGQIGPDAKATVPRIVEMLKDKEFPDVFAAAKALKQMGPGVGPAVVELLTYTPPGQEKLDQDSGALFVPIKALGSTGENIRRWESGSSMNWGMMRRPWPHPI